MKKNTKRHLHIHPLHLHGSLVLAFATMLVVAMKTSNEMAHSLQGALPTSHVAAHSIELREAETRHDPAMVSMAKIANYAGE